MIKTIVLGPATSPLVRTYNNKDNIIAIDKHTNSTDFISAGEVLPYSHSLLINGRVRDVLITISSEEKMTEEQLTRIINNTPM
jgi:uncharacterized radical SAM superfamily Fe-S cluster-containing enzyme